MKEVLILADIYESFNGLSDYVQEWESLDSVLYLKDTILSLGYRAYILEPYSQKQDILNYLSKNFHNKDNVILFNLVEGYNSRSREALVPALAELFGFPYTGSNAYLQCLTLDKYSTIQIANTLKIPTPDTYRIQKTSDLNNAELNYPMFLKPNYEGSSIGIHSENIIQNKESLLLLTDKLLKKYPVLILQEYLSGRDLTVGIIGNYPNYKITEIAGIDYQDTVYSADIKTKSEMPEKLSFNISKELSLNIKNYCMALANCLQIYGYARADFKLERGKPKFLEINLTPGLSYLYSSFPLCYQHSFGSYTDMILEILKLSDSYKTY